MQIFEKTKLKKIAKKKNEHDKNIALSVRACVCECKSEWRRRI